jgi:hypothetical protein
MNRREVPYVLVGRLRLITHGVVAEQHGLTLEGAEEAYQRVRAELESRKASALVAQGERKAKARTKPAPKAKRATRRLNPREAQPIPA